MKKYLLLASAAVFAISTYGQDKSQAAYRGTDRLERIDQESNNGPIKDNQIPNEKVASTVLLGTSYNVFTVLGDRQNQVVYNPDINTVGFVHRQNDGGVGGSGVVSFDYSTDGGANWIINPFQLTPGLGGGNGNRYPNITLYNPSANNDPANAYVVATGPQLQTGVTSGANGWGGTFRASAMLDGTNPDEQYTNLSTDAVGDNNEWGAAGLYTAANGVVFDVTTNIDNAQANGVADSYSNYFINRGDYNAGNNNFDWTVATTVTPGWHTTGGATPTNVSGLANMAWSPNGMIGYMVAMGADSNASMNTMWRPYVMKSTDGGTTWNNVNDYDFSTDAVLQNYIWGLNTDTTIKRPFFSSYDMIVDANGELRIFAEIASGFSADPDSLNFTFAARQAGFLFEVATNGTGWDVTFIDSVLVDDFEWDATNTLSHFVRPQASRSQDGSMAFYTWIGSDISISPNREFPDVWGIAHDVTLGNCSGIEWSVIKNLSTGTNAEFVSAYQTIAAQTIENGLDETWEVPIVYGTAVGGSALIDGLSPPQWNFIRGVGFTCATDFVSVEQYELSDNDVMLYPNPTSGAVEIRIDNVRKFDYTIIDIVGNIVATNNVNGNQTSINLSNNAKGVYFVKVNTENGSITKKVMLTK